MELVNRVRELQIRNGYSDQIMAEAIGCSRPTYQRTRTGTILPGGSFLRGAERILSQGTNRVAVIKRETRETSISLEFNIDGSGNCHVDTGIQMLDHFLDQVASHGRFDLKVTANGDDQHHLVEDVAICLGQALNQALGEKRGIMRMADVSVPMDDALATLALDISGRGYAVLELSFSKNDMAGFATDLMRHFFESFAIEARINLHARIVYGTNDHHKAEALFKALGRVLDGATRLDERIAGELPSTKKRLES